MEFEGNIRSRDVDGIPVTIPSKKETHYLPDSPLGNEMCKLFMKANELGLTFQASTSGTFVSPHYDPNLRKHLPPELSKPSLGPYSKLHNSTMVTDQDDQKKKPIAELTNLASNGLCPSFGVIFRIHMKTSTTGGARRHGYPDVGGKHPLGFLDEIKSAREKYGFQQQLDTTELERLIKIEKDAGRIKA
ncbi:hypothetical protein GCM10023116_05230 [Kistimonas scapharcae]|uniref:Uncharacterized protein n=2 Tax=Kistimonas scapharcae TaxID=1036133 RepID=A0ABP8UXI9_9GAMM